jgi:signal transduction histidine kinase
MKENATILVVEDSRTQAIELQFLLESNGYIVHVTNDGKQALQWLQTELPDVIITDIVMPEVNGYELCRAIREDSRMSHIPVVLLTSLSAPDDVIEGLKCGADNFLTKPFEKESLLARLHYILINREMRSEKPSSLGLNIFFGGKQHTITAERVQILDLFFSSFEIALQKNRQLEASIRQLRETQEYLRSAKGEVEQAMQQVKDANRAKSRFLSNMTHELRTPLSAVIGMSDLLFDSDLNYDQNEYVTTIKSASECLLVLVDDILDLSHIESRKVVIEQADFDLYVMIELIAGIFRKQTVEQGLDFIVNIDSSTPRYVVSDETRLRQILINLLSNAVKFTHKGSVTLNVKVVGNAKSSKVQIRFEVCDTGVGIPKEQQQSLLDAFVQADNSPTRRHGGSGIGLAIVSRLIHLLESEIEINSQINCGSTFAFEVNLEKASQASAETLSRKTKPDKSKSATRPTNVGAKPDRTGRIMIVEDNRVNQLLLSNIFKKFGCEVEIAKTGRDACDMVTKMGDTIDLIFMDLQMPVMDGIDATVEIRKLELEKNSDRRVPIIALTANDSAEDKAKCIESGMDDHLSKPFRKQLIIECLNKWL